jgi:hypothetical protein
LGAALRFAGSIEQVRVSGRLTLAQHEESRSAGRRSAGLAKRKLKVPSGTTENPVTRSRVGHHRNSKPVRVFFHHRGLGLAKAVPKSGRLSSFSLFDNLLTPMNNGFCEECVGNKEVAHGLDGYP